MSKNQCIDSDALNSLFVKILEILSESELSFVTVKVLELAFREREVQISSPVLEDLLRVGVNSRLLTPIKKEDHEK